MITVKGIPAYVQVAGAIGDRIAFGEFERGARLPTRVSFARYYRVSEAVVRSAMNTLERQGLVRRDAHSTALYVAESRPRTGQGDLAPFLHRLEAVEAQLLNDSSPAAPTVQGQGVGAAAWLERSVWRGVAVLRGTGGVLARLGFRGGRAHGRRAAGRSGSR